MLPAPIPMTAAKNELRSEMRALRLGLDGKLARKAAGLAASHLASLPAFSRARAVALYSPVRGEIDTAPILATLRARGIVTCYPCMAPGHRVLSFHDVADPAQLVKNRLDIPEPTSTMPIVDATQIDVVVVPGLAFDQHGCRLGWGRAYYDTTLHAVPAALRLGLAYDFQIVASVPSTPSDERMDVLCTETGLRMTHARPLLRRNS